MKLNKALEISLIQNGKLSGRSQAARASLHTRKWTNRSLSGALPLLCSKQADFPDHRWSGTRTTLIPRARRGDMHSSALLLSRIPRDDEATRQQRQTQEDVFWPPRAGGQCLSCRAAEGHSIRERLGGSSRTSLLGFRVDNHTSLRSDSELQPATSPGAGVLRAHCPTVLYFAHLSPCVSGSPSCSLSTGIRRTFQGTHDRRGRRREGTRRKGMQISSAGN